MLLCWEHYFPPTHILFLCRRELWWHLFSWARMCRILCQPKQLRVQTCERRNSVFVQNAGTAAWRAATKEEKNRTAQQQGGEWFHNKKSLMWGNNTTFDVPSCINSDDECYSFFEKVIFVVCCFNLETDFLFKNCSSMQVFLIRSGVLWPYPLLLLKEHFSLCFGFFLLKTASPSLL